MCNGVTVQIDDGDRGPGSGTRDRILDVALEVLGERPGAGMGEIAAAAGVVRRTVYGHFPGRSDLVRSIARRAADELRGDLLEIGRPSTPPEAAWVAYVARVWPLAHRYRILLVLRRSEYGDDIHAQLAPVEQALAALVQRGQDSGAFGHHLPAAELAQLAQSIVFTLADQDGADGVAAATITSLLTLGVPADVAERLVRERG